MKIAICTLDGKLALNVFEVTDAFRQLSLYEWDSGEIHIMYFNGNEFAEDKVLPPKKAVEMFNGLLNKHFDNTL